MNLSHKRMALCLSGQARAVKACLSSIQDCIIKPFGHVDVFIHTWFVDKYSTDKFNVSGLETSNVFDCSLQEYLDCYNPASVAIEDFARSKYFHCNNLSDRVRIAFYVIHKSNQVKREYEIENNLNYDYVIRCRTDLKFERRLTEQDLECVNDGSILIPSMLDFGGVNDQFAIGTPTSMNKYASLHNRLDKYLFVDGLPYDPERLMKHHINSMNLELHRFRFDYSIVKKSMKYPPGKGYIVTDTPEVKKYLTMQKDSYDSQGSHWTVNAKDYVVGSYEAHNRWADYDLLLFKGFDTKGLVALEYGCGPGRNLIRFKDRFSRIDGVDISSVVLDKARENLEHEHLPIPNLVLSDGKSIDRDDHSYDVVFSVICMQHICVHEIRYNIFKEIYRVLKPGGYMCIQMGFGGKYVEITWAKYKENCYDATATNGFYDVSIENEDELKRDLYEIGFKNYKSDIAQTGPGDNHRNWIWFQVQK